MVDGKVVEDPEDDVETGTNTCCGSCRHTEKQQTDVVVISTSNEDQQSLAVAGDVSAGCFSSSENPAKDSDDEHISLLAKKEDDRSLYTSGGLSWIGNNWSSLGEDLHKAAAAAFWTSDREEKYHDTEGNKTDAGVQTEMINSVPDLYDEERLNMEGGEVSETPDEDLETIRQSEKIVSDLMDNLITDIIAYFRIDFWLKQ